MEEKEAESELYYYIRNERNLKKIKIINGATQKRQKYLLVLSIILKIRSQRNTNKIIFVYVYLYMYMHKYMHMYAYKFTSAFMDKGLRTMNGGKAIAQSL